MKRTVLTLILIPVILLSACRNGRTVQTSDTPQTILENMRKDSAVIAFADSMGVVQLGPGTKCIDPVKHTYLRDGRTFLYNEDWGGVLELPQGWIPEDDLWQAELSFHGTHVWSPDSTILMATYAGISVPDLDQLEITSETLASQGFTITSHEQTRILIGEEPALCLTVLALGEDGIIYLGKTVTTESRCIEYSASLQYDEKENSERIDILKSFLERYPLGPEGQTPIGYCLF